MINLHCNDCNIDINITGEIPEGSNINCLICGALLKDGYGYEDYDRDYVTHYKGVYEKSKNCCGCGDCLYDKEKK
jgi:hypothetical protein